MRQPSESLVVQRARALFASSLCIDSRPNHAERETAIRDAIRSCGGPSGCLANVAFAFGDHPDTAVARMRWARQTASMTCSPTTELRKGDPCK
jgi:hypothetical protein